MITSLNKPGDIFASAMRKITGTAPCPGTYRARIQQMNALGWWRCWRNRKQIVRSNPMKVFTP